MLELWVTDTLVLRLWQESHAPTIFSLVEQNRAHLQDWVHWVRQTKTAEHIREFVRYAEAEFAQGRSYQLGIWCEGQPVGGVGLVVNPANRSAQLGYWLVRSWQGQGIVTQACRRLLAYGFEELGLNRVELRIAPTNQRSQAVARRLGCAYEGTLRQSYRLDPEYLDETVYSLLRSEWRCCLKESASAYKRTQQGAWACQQTGTAAGVRGGGERGPVAAVLHS